MLSVKIIRVIKDFITTNEIQYKHNSFLLSNLNTQIEDTEAADKMKDNLHQKF